MKSEGTFQYTTLHGIVFNTSQITLTENERGRLRELHFGEAKNAHYPVSNKVVDVYDKMLAKNLPCVMKIGISQPLSRQQADTLNTQRTSVANLTASAFGGAAGTVGGLAGPAGSFAVGTCVTAGCARTSMALYPPTTLAT